MSWDELYALFCVETGWSWEYVDEEMTVPRSKGFIELWKLTPPLRATLRAIAIGLGASPAPEKSLPSGKNKLGLQAYLEGFGAAGLQVERVKHG
jgi:hypothetical protein